MNQDADLNKLNSISQELDYVIQDKSSPAVAMLHVTTAKMDQDLVHAQSLQEFFQKNKAAMLGPLRDFLNKQLYEKNITVADVLRDSGLNKSYTYQVFSGQKTPSRDKLIAIGFGLHLDLENFQRMLKLGGCSELYTRVWRDAAIKFCILHGFDIWKTDEILHSLDFDMILNYD